MRCSLESVHTNTAVRMFNSFETSSLGSTKIDDAVSEMNQRRAHRFDDFKECQNRCTEKQTKGTANVAKQWNGRITQFFFNVVKGKILFLKN